MRSTRVLGLLVVGALALGPVAGCFENGEPVLVRRTGLLLLDLPSTGTGDAEVTIFITNVGHAETGLLGIASSVSGFPIEHAGTGGTCEQVATLRPLDTCTVNFGVQGGTAPTGPYEVTVTVTGTNGGGIVVPINVG